jgi:hypothetical protein
MLLGTIPFEQMRFKSVIWKYVILAEVCRWFTYV